jgi:hypothetical protein
LKDIALLSVGEFLMSTNNGVWSEISFVRVCTVTFRYCNYQSLLTKTLSNFSYVGFCRQFAHVNCRPDSANSLKFKLLMTSLNKKGHLSSYLLLFFSLGLLMMLKSPPTKISNVSSLQVCTSSCRKLCFLSSCAGPYTEIRIYWKLVFLFLSLNFT